ncbi:MAG: hypothetical protein AB7T31_03880 [Gemmatimonadales bacterium]
MKLPKSFASAALALVLIVGVQDSLSAQVVEERESESNPVVTIFRGTLYGAGTGLLLGGAWALVESDGADETRDILKWGAAGGAMAGAAVGLIYVLLRPQPEGDADVVGMVDASNGRVRFGAPTLLARRVNTGGLTSTAFEARLLQARF